MNWKKTMATLFMAGLTAVSFADNNENNNPINDKDMENLNLTAEWDKTFLKSDKVNHSKVTFTNRYGITLAADMYVPKNTDGKLPAIAVCGPFGAVRGARQAGLCAQTMAEQGLPDHRFRPLLYGREWRRTPLRGLARHKIQEDFSAAFDFLATNDRVDAERIGIIGICGWGGLAINAAAAEPAHQSHRRFHDVRHEPGECQRLFRCR